MKVLALVALALLVTGLTAEAAPRRKGAAPAPRNTYDSYQSQASSSGRSGHRMAGCGLGSMVVEDSSKWAQVGAAFLNGTGVQTFGISFGTSNCTEDGVAVASREKDAFVEANLADLQRDVAAGEGEYLSSLASLYGCKGESAKAFGQGLHQNQNELLNVSSGNAAAAIDSVVASQSLACQG